MISDCLDYGMKRTQITAEGSYMHQTSRDYSKWVKKCDESGIRTHALSDQIPWSSDDLVLSLAP